MSHPPHDNPRPPAPPTPDDPDLLGQPGDAPLSDGQLRPRREPGVRRASTAGGLTPDGRFKAGKLAGRGMGSAILVLSWPILVQSFLSSLVGLTDTVLAAGVSEAATDAIGGGSYVMWFIGLVITAIAVGSTALISRAVGGGRMAVANAALGQAVLLALTSGVAVGLLIAAVAGPASRAMSMGPEAAAAFQRYMVINAAGVPLMAMLFIGIECVRAAGDSLRPLLAMVVVNIVNIVVSWVLAGVDFTATSIVGGVPVTRTVLANPFPFDLGVTGIAIGTVASSLVGAAIVLRLLLQGRSGIILRRRRLRPHWHTMRRLVRVGLPNFLEMLGMWVGNFAIVLMVGWLTLHGVSGGGLLGAHIVAIRIEAFSFLPGFAMGAAAATLAGQYLGAGSPAMAKRATFLCTAIAAGVMGSIGLAFLLIPRQIVGVLSSQPTHLEIVPQVLWIAGFVQIPFATAIVLRSAMRGAGDVKVVMWMTWASTWGLRLPLAYALSGVDIPVPGWMWWGEGASGIIRNPFWSEGGLVGLWIGLCAELVIRAAMFSVRFVQGGWLRARV